MVVSCRGCQKGFGLLRTKYFCSICSSAVCSHCSSQDLIVYVPNSDEGFLTYSTDSGLARLCIIKIIGVSMYLNVSVIPRILFFLRDDSILIFDFLNFLPIRLKCMNTSTLSGICNFTFNSMC